MQVKTIGIHFVFACLFLGVGGLGCGSSPARSPPDPNAFGNKYKIADNQIPGWTQDPDPTTYWTGTDLVTAGIDGGNVLYDEKGFRQGMFEILDAPNQECDLRAMDFGTDAKATAMFTYQQKANQASISIGQYDASTAIGSSVIGGINAFAHFGASYFELALTGFADQASAASVAAKFLAVLQADQ